MKAEIAQPMILQLALWAQRKSVIHVPQDEKICFIAEDTMIVQHDLRQDFVE